MSYNKVPLTRRMYCVWSHFLQAPSEVALTLFSNILLPQSHIAPVAPKSAAFEKLVVITLLHNPSNTHKGAIMSRSRVLQSSRLVTRAVRSSTTTVNHIAPSALRPTLRRAPLQACIRSSPSLRCSLFSTSAPRSKGIMPETNSPSQATPAESSINTAKPADLTDNQYHEIADIWLENALNKFEDIQDQAGEIDVEFSVCLSFWRCSTFGLYMLALLNGGANHKSSDYSQA